jgi:tetratricopeptide (TPR) repeat protein
MPPHGSAKKKKKGRDGTGKKKSRAGGARDHGRASSGVGGGSSLENLIDSGNEHLAMDRVEEGLNDLRKACALVPDSADAWDAYGMALAEFGAPDDAIKVLKRAAQLSPNIGYEKVSFFFISVWAIGLTCFFSTRSSCTSGNCWTTAKLPRRARAKA